MSQRQLAERSGVDHSTISRLVRGHRVPSLETATKLMRALDEFGPSPALAELPGQSMARVEHALRADKALHERDIKKIMYCYLGSRGRGGASTRSR
jgi:transcriptional regulator with XRE-family HTH domain